MKYQHRQNLLNPNSDGGGGQALVPTTPPSTSSVPQTPVPDAPVPSSPPSGDGVERGMFGIPTNVPVPQNVIQEDGWSATPQEALKQGAASAAASAAAPASPVPAPPSAQPSAPAPAPAPAQPTLLELLGGTPAPAPATQPAVTLPNTPTGQRDLTGIPPEYHQIVGQMSRPAYEAFANEVRQHTALKTQTEQLRQQHAAELQSTQARGAFEHENGWMLSADVRQTQNDLGINNKLIEFYQTQLALCQAGKPFQDVEQRQDGTIGIKAGTLAPTIENSVAIQTQLNRLMIRDQALQTQFQQQRDGHITAHRAFNGKILALADRYFKPLQPIIASQLPKVLEQFPEHVRNVPIYQGYANALVVIDLLAAKLAAATRAGGTPQPAPPPSQVSGAPSGQPAAPGAPGTMSEAERKQYVQMMNSIGRGEAVPGIS